MYKYIKLEDVQKILSKTSDKYQSEYTWWWIVSKIQEELNSLPSIDFEWRIQDSLETLDEIYCDSSEEWEIRRTYNAMKWILKDLLNNLPK